MLTFSFKIQSKSVFFANFIIGKRTQVVAILEDLSMTGNNWHQYNNQLNISIINNAALFCRKPIKSNE